MSRDISNVFLLEVSTGSMVEAELFDAITEDELLDWQTYWLPSLAEGMRKLKEAGVSRDQWPESSHWNWRKKISDIEGMLACPTICVKHGGVTQGLMMLNLPRFRHN